MSGLEIVGVTASILQLAELGTQLSVKLCALYRRLKHADEHIQSLANDVALTSNVMRQLGDNLRQDEQAKLYSGEAFDTTHDVIDECKKVFEQIRDAIDGPQNRSTKGRIQRAGQKLGFLMVEQDLEILRSNLERLKSTLLLMLNVIMYAEQLRSRATKPSALGQQRDLLQILLDDKKASDEQFKALTNALQSSGISVPPLQKPQPDNGNFNMMLGVLTTDDHPLSRYKTSDLPKYYDLLKQMLADVDGCKSDLELSRYTRIKKGLFSIHSEETLQYARTHEWSAVSLLRTQFSSAFEDCSFDSEVREEVRTYSTKNQRKTVHFDMSTTTEIWEPVSGRIGNSSQELPQKLSVESPIEHSYGEYPEIRPPVRSSVPPLPETPRGTRQAPARLRDDAISYADVVRSGETSTDTSSPPASPRSMTWADTSASSPLPSPPPTRYHSPPPKREWKVVSSRPEKPSRPPRFLSPVAVPTKASLAIPEVSREQVSPALGRRGPDVALGRQSLEWTYSRENKRRERTESPPHVESRKKESTTKEDKHIGAGDTADSSVEALILRWTTLDVDEVKSS